MNLTCDLHAHTLWSDGSLAPAELVRAAAAAGLAAVAVTDHDTVAGVAEAVEAGRTAGVEVIAGIEVTAEAPGGVAAHILGYFVDPRSPYLREPLENLRRRRARRAERILERLAATGVRIDLPPPRPGASIGRPHVARALVAGGRAATVDEAFRRYLDPGAPAHVPAEALRPDEAIALVRRSGGVAILAHPEAAIAAGRAGAWVAAGLGGIEALYGPYDSERRRALERWAAERGLLATGGSDFHGDVKPRIRLGDERWPYAVVEALRRRAERAAS